MILDQLGEEYRELKELNKEKKEMLKDIKRLGIVTRNNMKLLECVFSSVYGLNFELKDSVFVDELYLVKCRKYLGEKDGERLFSSGYVLASLIPAKAYYEAKGIHKIKNAEETFLMSLSKCDPITPYPTFMYGKDYNFLYYDTDEFGNVIEPIKLMDYLSDYLPANFNPKSCSQSFVKYLIEVLIKGKNITLSDFSGEEGFTKKLK